AFYFAMVVLSAFQAWYPKLSLFYPWQLARMFLVYATVTRGCVDLKVTQAIMTGLGAGVLMESGLVIWQRSVLGMVQAGGTSHQNLLGVMLHLVVLPYFALLVGGRRGIVSTATVVAGIVAVISTASRATIGLEGFGL